MSTEDLQGTDDVPGFGEGDDTIAVDPPDFDMTPDLPTPGQPPRVSEEPGVVGFDHDEPTAYMDPDIHRTTLVPEGGNRTDRPTDPAAAAAERGTDPPAQPAVPPGGPDLGVTQAFGKYTIGPPVGTGGMADVRLGYERLGHGSLRACVIKRIATNFLRQQKYREMFEEESRLSRLLHHPHIVEAFDAGVVDEVPFICFELIDGVTLSDLRKHAKTQLPLGAIVEVGLAVAKALAYAHALSADGQALNLVHRDVSPQNILISRHGQVKLVDFGIARFEGRMFMTMAGEVKGKMKYMAPEQLAEETLDGRTDIFALGIVIAEQLDHLQEGLTDSFCSGILANPGTMPVELHRLLLRMTAPKPDDRPRVAADVVRELEQISLRLGLEGELLPFATSRVFANRPPLAPEQAVRRAPKREVKVRLGNEELIAPTDFDNPDGAGLDETVMRYSDILANASESEPTPVPEPVVAPQPKARPRSASTPRVGPAKGVAVARVQPSSVARPPEPRPEPPAQTRVQTPPPQMAAQQPQHPQQSGGQMPNPMMHPQQTGGQVPNPMMHPQQTGGQMPNPMMHPQQTGGQMPNPMMHPQMMQHPQHTGGQVPNPMYPGMYGTGGQVPNPLGTPGYPHPGYGQPQTVITQQSTQARVMWVIIAVLGVLIVAGLTVLILLLVR